MSDKCSYCQPQDTCQKCGKRLSPSEIARGIKICVECREKIFHEIKDNGGWV